MQSNSTKRAAVGATAASEADVLLVPNDSPGGGNFYSGWLRSAKNQANSQQKELALHLSFMDTNVRYNAPLPNRAMIIAKSTQPAVPAGPDDDPPAIAAVVPTNAIVSAMEQDMYVRRNKLMDSVESCGTQAWTFFEARISHDSWQRIEADPRYDAAESSPIKNAFVLWEIICSTHAETAAAGGVPLSSQDRERIKDDFHAFQQGKLDLGEFHKQYIQWMKRRVAAGLALMGEQEQVATFFRKLNPHLYGDFLRERENDERKLILLGQPVPAISLSLALSLARGYISPSGSKHDSSKKALSVFTVESKPDRPDAEEIKMACRVLASAVPGASSQSVLLALTNANFGASTAGGGGSKGSLAGCPPLMVRGKAWTAECSVPGCKERHPFYLHEALTGKLPDAASQIKIDAFAARKVHQGKKKGDGAKEGRVLIAKGKQRTTMTTTMMT